MEHTDQAKQPLTEPKLGVAPQPGALYQYHPDHGFVPVQPVAGAPSMAARPGEAATGGYPLQGARPEAQQAPYGAYTNPAAAESAMPGQGYSQGAAQPGVPGTPEGAEPKFDQNRWGEVYGVVNDVMNGEADPGKILGLLQSEGGEFWKGAAVGAAAVFLFNNETVRHALAGTLGAIFPGGGNSGNPGESGAEAAKAAEGDAS